MDHCQGKASCTRIESEPCQLLQSADGALDAGLVVALVCELGRQLAAGVRPEGQQACGRSLLSQLLILRLPCGYPTYIAKTSVPR